jgi:hypothetical protein
VIQHLKKQEEAVSELCRITRDQGDLILELYNTWNLKTIWKEIRMSKIRPLFNAPFKLFFRSLSPFSEWGINYDNYNHWFEVKPWLKNGRMHGLKGRGVGFGFHKYFFDAFFINGIGERHVPKLLRGYYDAAFAFEKRFGALIPLRYVMEKVVMKATKNAPEQDRGLVRKIYERARDTVRTSSLANREAFQELAREHSQRDVLVRDNTFHLKEAVEWLKRAQDATSDKGVSRGYSVGWNNYLQNKGWQASYPETTGYIIPTMFDSAAFFKDEDLRRRAIEMADWEISVQMNNGAVMGGIINANPSPAVFNTGQVILGWLRAYNETKHTKYLEACERAANYLISVQDEDGNWRKGNSRFANSSTTTYNARVGWALILAGQQLGNQDYVKAGDRNIRFSIGKQKPNGWFRENCLTNPQAPLLHTICYVVEGILGAAEALDRDEYFVKARLTADALISRIRANGSLPGRFDEGWNGTVEWSCLTGNAQLAGILLKLFSRAAHPSYQTSAQRILSFLKRTQHCTSANPGLRGGIKGAYPFDGEYGKFEVLNWATKFYVDALLLDDKLTTESNPSGVRQLKAVAG